MKMRKHKSTFRDVQGLCIPPTSLNGVSERERENGIFLTVMSSSYEQTIGFMK